MSQNYLVGPNGPTQSAYGAAIYLPNRKHPAFTVFNIGAAIVFLDDQDPLTDPSTGIPLNVGSAIVWDADRPLYAICPTQGTLTIADNTGIPSVDAASIAAAINGQGLAQGIASAVLQTGIVVTDRLTTLLDVPTTTSYSSPTFATGAYQSIQIHTQNTGGNPMQAGRVLVVWRDGAGVLVGQDVVFLGGGFYMDAVLPVRGQQAFVNIQSLNGLPGSASLKIFGSYKTADARYFSDGAGSTVGTINGSSLWGLQSWAMQIPPAYTAVWDPDTLAGGGQFTFSYGPSGDNVAWSIGSPPSIQPGTYRSGGGPVTAGSEDFVQLWVPPMPVEITVTNTGGSNLDFLVTYVNERPYQ